MMLVPALVVTALLVSDVAGMVSSLEEKETLRAIGELTRGPCEIGWFVYGPTRSCYRCFTTKKTWNEAETSCNREKHYGQLASVSSCDHNEFITKVVRKAKNGIRRVWIGLKDFSKKGTFSWSDKSSMRHLRWAAGRPLDPKYNRHCTYTNPSNNAWFDQSCRSNLYYVCAYKLH